MRKKTVFYQLFFFQVLLLITALGLTTILFSHSIKNFYYEDRRQDIFTITTILRNYLEKDGFPMAIGKAEISENLVKDTGSRITLVLPDGTVVADSKSDAQTMSNHAKRPEIVTALNGGRGYSLRFSSTVSKSMMYAALPVKKEGRIVGVVRVSVPVDSISKRISSVYISVALLSLAVFILAIAISWFTARRFSLVVKELKGTAALYAKEDFDHKVYIENPVEFRQLGAALTSMGKQLKSRLQLIREQKQELLTILNSMNEPLIFTDNNIHIIKMNAAAEKLFGKLSQENRGKNLLEVFRNSKFHSFAESLLQSGKPGSEEFLFNESGDIFFEVHGTPLKEDLSKNDRLLLVLHDISQRKKLELMRKEFVSSVSHELKTPVTNIKGYVETLLFSKNMDEKQTQSFLKIISRHTNRLTAIIDDLLTLSEIEKTGQNEIKKEKISAHDLISSVKLVTSPNAVSKNIKIKTDYKKKLVLNVHPLLAEQAIVNLVDNAIKYSPENTKILIRAYKNDKTGRTIIEVVDQGPGIPSCDIERIFERFYRVDKARSRQAGGTGLGLSIVKHIALVHGGSVSVKSTEGKGSTFRIEF